VRPRERCAAEGLRPGADDLPVLHAESFRKQLTAAGFQLKGSGWYVTDFRGGNGAAAPATPGRRPEGRRPQPRRRPTAGRGPGRRRRVVVVRPAAALRRLLRLPLTP
jgi:hypothetical protein